MPSRRLVTAAAAAALALPALALAQDRPESILPPGFGEPLPPPQQQPAQNQATPSPSAARPGAGSPGQPGSEELQVSELTEEAAAQLLEAPPPPVEIPDFARRDPRLVGGVDPQNIGIGQYPWGGASGRFLSTVMRRMEPPAASRWAHLLVRNALLARALAPGDVNPADWVAERAWLLLRMGEADAARMLVSGVDVDRFTPKMFQVATQSALANADPAGLCPLQGGIARVEPAIAPLVQAMCAALSGEPESASAQIEQVRRRGRIGGPDLALADKVVGAGTNGRSVSIDWGGVDRLNSWRFGLATATGVVPPGRLLDSASLQVRAWQARAPILAPQDRLQAARIATGLGVFSSQSLIDLYSAIYESSDPDDLPQSDAWQLRLAFAGRDQAERLAAMRKLWGSANADPLQRQAARALVGRAATLIAPDPKLQADAPELIASMLAAGYDRAAARWAGAISRMDDAQADRSWAMLALAAPEASGLDIGYRRIAAFLDRDESSGQKRGAMLVAALAGLGRIDSATADRLNRSYGLGIGRTSRWTALIDGAARRGQAGTVAVLTGTGMQTRDPLAIPSAHVLHSTAALKRTGQEFAARMIAAELLART